MIFRKLICAFFYAQVIQKNAKNAVCEYPFSLGGPHIYL